MFLKQSRRKKDGRNYMVLAKSVRDPVSKVSRTVTVESLGYEDELKKTYDDPVAYFKAEAKRRTMEEEQLKKAVQMEINPQKRLTLDNKNRKNLGFIVLSKIFHKLKLDEFVQNRQRYKNFKFNALSITKLLVYSRLLFPASKKKTWENRGKYFEVYDCSLDDVYRCLSFLIEYKDDLTLYLHQQIQNEYGRETDIVYYDVTNYYFESEIQDDIRKNGFGKQRRGKPLVQMGLFMDTEGLPITYELFPGNIVDSKTVMPLLGDIMRQYDMGRVIVVADKGVITGDVINYALSGKNGYIFSFSIRGATDEFKSFVLKQEDYNEIEFRPISTEDEQEECVFKVKSRLTPREIHVTTVTGAKKKRTVHEKQVVYYSRKYAQKAKRDREQAIEKAKKLISSPADFTKNTAYGAAKYVQNIQYDEKTGEILDDCKHLLYLDEEKIKQEAIFDGYYALVTSEYKYSEQKIIDIYRGLWQIEETFRITKSDLETRPIFHSREDRIRAHFLTCYLALVIGRLLEKSLGDKYSIAALVESLRNACGSLFEQNWYVFDYLDQILLDIGNIYDIDFSLKYRRIGDIKKLIAQTKK